MGTKAFTALLCGFALAGQMRGQEVVVGRETKPKATERAAPLSQPSDSEPGNATPTKARVRAKKSASTLPTVEQMRMAGALAGERLTNPPRIAATTARRESSPQKAKSDAVPAEPMRKEKRVEQSSAQRRSKTGTTKSEVVAPVRPTLIESGKRETDTSQPTKSEPRSGQTSAPQSTNRSQSLNRSAREPDPISAESVNLRTETAFTKLASGFDFPVGIPDAQGYYKARGFRSQGHLGEDWDGVRGGDTDRGDPVYSIGDGLVVFARDCHMGWGNVIIVRHSYRESGVVKNIDAFYGHLNKMLVHRGQAVARGQEIATMGTAHGLYDAHLHLEIRKNIEIGMSRSAFAQDLSNYYDPSQFILAHRHLSTSGGPYRVAMNTFVRDARINFNKARNYSHSRSGGGT